MIGYGDFVAMENVLYADQADGQPTMTSHGVVVFPSWLMGFLYAFLRLEKRSVGPAVPCVLDGLRKVDVGRCGALLKICFSALKSCDVMCWGCAGVVGGVLLARGVTLRNASFACLVGGGGQSAIGVCFKAETVFRAGSTVVVCLDWGVEAAQGISSPLLEADSEWNAHKASAVGSDLMDSLRSFVFVDFRR